MLFDLFQTLGFEVAQNSILSPPVTLSDLVANCPFVGSYLSRLKSRPFELRFHLCIPFPDGKNWRINN